MNLKDQGFRFVMRDGGESRQFVWVDPSEVGPNDVDCTGMDDDAFARLQDVNRAITDAGLESVRFSDTLTTSIRRADITERQMQDQEQPDEFPNELPTESDATDRELLDILRELVACRDLESKLHERIARLHRGGHSKYDQSRMLSENLDDTDELKRCWPAAWELARAAAKWMR